MSRRKLSDISQYIVQSVSPLYALSRIEHEYGLITHSCDYDSPLSNLSKHNHCCSLNQMGRWYNPLTVSGMAHPAKSLEYAVLYAIHYIE